MGAKKKPTYLVIDMEGRSTRVAADKVNYNHTTGLVTLETGNAWVAVIPREALQMVVEASSVKA